MAGWIDGWLDCWMHYARHLLSPVDLSSALHISSIQLLVQRILDPQVDVTSPVTLITPRWQVGNGPFVHLQKTKGR